MQVPATQTVEAAIVEYDYDAEMAYDVACYDEAKANDDGYRISAADLRKKYGI